MFITVVIMSQVFTQMNLGNIITQAQNIADTLDAGRPQENCTAVRAFVIVAGRLREIYGIRKLWVYEWLWSAVFSILCGFCGYTEFAVTFDIFRALMGICPPSLMPNASALVRTASFQAYVQGKSGIRPLRRSCTRRVFHRIYLGWNIRTIGKRLEIDILGNELSLLAHGYSCLVY